MDNNTRLFWLTLVALFSAGLSGLGGCTAGAVLLVIFSFFCFLGTQ